MKNPIQVHSLQVSIMALACAVMTITGGCRTMRSQALSQSLQSGKDYQTEPMTDASKFVTLNDDIVLKPMFGNVRLKLPKGRYTLVAADDKR